MPLKVIFSFWRGKFSSWKQSITCQRKKTDGVEAYSRRPRTILSGMQEPKEETRENIKTSVLENPQKTSLAKGKIESNVDKFHWTGRFDHETETQPIILKLKIHSFKEKMYHQLKKLVQRFKISLSLRKQHSDILQQLQHIIKK